jgi:spore cortex formation protein SpoVR/YcgB (stage V sporulation)
MYVRQSNIFVEEIVITDRKAKEICEIIIRSFAHSGIPKVYVMDGNYLKQNELLLKHEHIGADLDPEYAQKTLEHIQFLWGEKCNLVTIKAKQQFKYVANRVKEIDPIDMDKL